MSRFPWITVAVALAAVVIAAIPGAADVAALDRSAPTAWRWVTGHIAHFSWNHLAWDLAVWVALGGWLEHSHRRGLLVVWGLSTVAVSAAFLWGVPDLVSYRGLSGIDSALFAAVVVQLWQTSTGRERWLPGGLAVALAGKVTFELGTGATLFTDAGGWTPVPLVHLVGAAAGALGWGVATLRRPR